MQTHFRPPSLLRALRIVLFLLIALCTLYLITGYYLINPLTRSLLPWIGEHQFDSRLQVQHVRFNPITLEATVDGLTLARNDGAPLASVRKIHVVIDRRDLLLHFIWHIRDASLDAPTVEFRRNRDGRTDWDELLVAVHKHRNPAPSPMPRLRIDRLAIRSGNLAMYDATLTPTPLDLHLQPLYFELRALSTLSTHPAVFNLTTRIDALGTRIGWNGTLLIDPLQSDGTVALDGLNVPQLITMTGIRLPLQLAHATVDSRLPYRLRLAGGNPSSLELTDGLVQLQQTDVTLHDDRLAQPLRLELHGLTTRFGLHMTLTPHFALQIAPLHAESSAVALFAGSQSQPLAQLQSIRLDDGSFDLAQHRLWLTTLHISGLRSQLVRRHDKQLSWSELLAHPAPKPAAAATAAATMPVPNSHATVPPPWDVRLAHLQLDQLQLAASDHVPHHAVQFDIDHGQIRADGLKLADDQPIGLDIAFDVRQGGHFHINGQLAPGATSGQFDVQLRALSLLPFGPYLNEVARLRLHDGNMTTQGTLHFARTHNQFPLRYHGSVAIDHLSIKEEDTGNDFLGWNRLSAHTLDFSLAPDRLRIPELDANQPFVKIIIFADHSINLDRIRRDWHAPAPAAASAAAPAPLAAADPTTDPSPAHATSTAPTAAGHKANSAFDIGVKRLRITRGSAEYADLSLPTPFGTRMHDLNGVVMGLSSRQNAIALVQIDGQVDQYGSVSLRGSIQPFHASDHTDLHLHFRNLEMARLTPYSGKFAGRKIDSGRMSADLEYTVHNRQLTGNNTFIIHQLKLGERVDSKDAFNLPLNLAIALLEDSNGVIQLDLPVSGNLDDPQFSYGRIIWKAVVNVLTKIVTAPFHALANLLGIETSQMEALKFPFGQAALPPPEQEKLQHLAQALAKRPALTLTITPGWQSSGDAQALRRLQLRQQVASAIGLHFTPGTDPGPLDPTDRRTQKVLAARYEKQFPALGGIKALRSETHVTHEWQLYETVIQRLRDAIPVNQTQLQQLAQQRGDAIRTQLEQVDKVEAARIHIAAPQANDRDSEMADSTIELGARE